MAEHEDIRYAYRLPPCPAWDVEGTESWLTDQAARGLILAQDGFFAGVAVFERREPQAVRYRLEAAQRAGGPLSDDAPDGEAVELGEALGWRYVTRRGEFYIYVSSAPGSRELNTDPAVQALALRAVTRRQWGNLFDLLFWLILYPLLLGRGKFLLAPVLTAIGIGSGVWLWGVLLAVWLAAGAVGQAVHLSRFRRRLARGEAVNHGKDWRHSTLRYWISRGLKLVLVLAWLCVMLSQWSASVLDEDEIPLADYAGDPPFATMADFAPGDYRTENYGFANTVRVWRDWLSPVNFSWDEIAAVTRPDGSVLEGSLTVDYHETRWVWAAERLAKEYQATDRRQAKSARNDRYAVLTLPDLGVDEAAAYRDSLGYATVVLRKGTTVVHARFYQTSASYTMELAAWAGVLAASLG